MAGTLGKVVGLARLAGWLAGLSEGGPKVMPEMENPRPSAVCGLITLSYSGRGWPVLKIRH